MNLQDHLNKPKLADKMARIIVWMDTFEVWLFVFGFVLFGIVVAICREMKWLG